jgi:tetratricopeptide (TPR) repeat protein
VVEAEINHCQQRIGQLRKSYFQWYGWMEFDPGPVESPEYSGEMVAFLRRFYAVGDSMGELAVSWLHRTKDHDLFFLEGARDAERWLFYLFRFDDNHAVSVRDAFFSLLRLVQGAKGEDAERLVAFHHTADCGLILTGMGEAVRVAPIQMDEDRLVGTNRCGDDPYRRGLRSLAVGDVEGALEMFLQSMGDKPYFRKAYVAAAVLSDQVRKWPEAEAATRMGLHYFPGDAVLNYHFGLARFRQGHHDDARVALVAALRARPAIFPARYLLGLIDLVEGRLLSAGRHLRMAAALPRPRRDRDAGHLRQLRAWLRSHAMLLGLGVAVAVAGALQLGLGYRGGGSLLLAGLISAAGSEVLFRVRMRYLCRDVRFRDVRLRPPEGLRADGFLADHGGL